MKQKLFLFVLLAGTLFSCKDDKGGINFLDNQELAINLPASFYATDQGGRPINDVADTILLRSDASWRAYVQDKAATWCSVSPAEGVGTAMSGYGNLVITAEDNDTFAERTCSVIIESYDNQYTVTVKQAAEVEVVIADAKFKERLVLDKNINTDRDDKISLSEARAVVNDEEDDYGNLRPFDLSGRGIKSLVGIEHFTNVTILDCSDNELDALDVSTNLKLVNLDCSENALIALDVSANLDLVDLDCSLNALTAITFGSNISLRSLDCSSNQLATLDVSLNKVLRTLDCSATYNENVTTEEGMFKNAVKLTTLDVSTNLALESLSCMGHALTTLNVGQNLALTSLACPYNQIATLDVSKNLRLTELYCTPMNHPTSGANLLSKLIVHQSHNPNSNNWEFPFSTDIETAQ